MINVEAAQSLNMNMTTKARIKEELIQNRTLSLFILIMLISIVMSIFYFKYFCSLYNISSILLTLSVEGVLAVGMMYLIVAGFFDLSVGSNLAVSGAVMAILLDKFPQLPFPVAIFLGMLASAFAGFLNGLMVRAGVNALIATLAMMGILRGIAILIVGASLGLPDKVIILGQKVILGFQMPVYYMIIIGIIGGFLLAKTRFFQQLYFIGGNRKGAVLSGINVNRMIIVIFTLMGALAGFSGIFLSAQLRAAVGQIGTGLEMRVIAAVIIGGGSLAGGKGTVAGALMGALFMGLLGNVMIISGISIYLQNIIIGLILVGAVSLDVTLQRKYGRAT